MSILQSAGLLFRHSAADLPEGQTANPRARELPASRCRAHTASPADALPWDPARQKKTDQYPGPSPLNPVALLAGVPVGAVLGKDHSPGEGCLLRPRRPRLPHRRFAGGAARAEPREEQAQQQGPRGCRRQPGLEEQEHPKGGRSRLPSTTTGPDGTSTGTATCGLPRRTRWHRSDASTRAKGWSLTTWRDHRAGSAMG